MKIRLFHKFFFAFLTVAVAIVAVAAFLVEGELKRELTLRISIGRSHQNLQAARSAFDTISDGHEFKSEFFPADAGGIPAEWVIAPGADKNRRVLYIHG